MDATKTKPVEKPKKKEIPPPGRKMSKQEARDFIFKKYAHTMELLARH